MKRKKSCTVIPQYKRYIAAAVAVAAVLFLWHISTAKLELSVTGVYPLRLAFILCLLFLVPVCACVLMPESGRGSRSLCLFVYAFLFLYSLFQLFYYENYVGRTPDELQHISYVAYLEEKNVLIPDFTEMISADYLPETSALDDIWRLDWTNDEINYLGHPPLYYQLLRLANAIHFENDGDVCVVNIARLRRFSMGIEVFALFLIFYIGFTRLDQRKPCLHLLYALITTSVPMMLYGAGGISNDTLALLTVTVYFLGILRFMEKKRDLKTYLLIAVGVTATLLTKTTAGMMTAIASVVVIVFCLIQEKSWKSLFRGSFYITLPLYLPAVLYFIYTYKLYGTFQPSLANFVSEEYFQNSGFYVQEENRAVMSLYQYFLYYKKEFFGSWTGIASHIALYKSTRMYAPDRIALLAIWIIPAVASVLFVRKRDNCGIACLGLYAAALIVAALQFVNAIDGFYSRGYRGGFQSRYYICVIAAFGLSIARLFEKGLTDLRVRSDEVLPEKNSFAADIKKNTMESKRQVLQKILFAAVIFYAVLLFYENFIYFLLNFTKYLSR